MLGREDESMWEVVEYWHRRVGKGDCFGSL